MDKEEKAQGPKILDLSNLQFKGRIWRVASPCSRTTCNHFKFFREWQLYSYTYILQKKFQYTRIKKYTTYKEIFGYASGVSRRLFDLPQSHVNSRNFVILVWNEFQKKITLDQDHFWNNVRFFFRRFHYAMKKSLDLVWSRQLSRSR